MSPDAFLVFHNKTSPGPPGKAWWAKMQPLILVLVVQLSILCFAPQAIFAEHLPGLSWMHNYSGEGGISCCSVFDCVEATVAYLDEQGGMVTVMIGETQLELPVGWVHPSQDGHGYWCFKALDVYQDGVYLGLNTYYDANGVRRAVPPEKPTVENSRCVFFTGTN